MDKDILSKNGNSRFAIGNRLWPFAAAGLILLIFMASVACNQDQKSPNREGEEGPRGGADGSPEGPIVFEDPENLPGKMTVKSFHLLVKEGGKDFSGYCIALSRDPKLGTEATDTIVVKKGGCPGALSIQGRESPMTYVCKPIEITKDVTQQVVLYSQLETGGAFKDTKSLSPEIIRGFCANPQAT